MGCCQKSKEMLRLYEEEEIESISKLKNHLLSDSDLMFTNDVLVSNNYILIDDLNIHINTNKIYKEDFEILKLLGEGSFGKVFLVRKKDTKTLHAMKILKKSMVRVRHQENHTKTERLLLEIINHPFIINLEYAFQNKENLYLVTEFMQGGELFYHLKNHGKFTEEEAKFYICEIIVALNYIHRNKCIYRDLKLENILLDLNGHIRLTDFGLSKIILEKKDTRAYTICGTPEYLAPEVLLEEGYGKEVDYWSLGVILFEMICGYSPFAYEIREIRKKIRTDPIFAEIGEKDLLISTNIYYKEINFPMYLSEEVKNLIKELVEKNPVKRLGYGKDGFENLKKNEFFKGVIWDDIIDMKIKPHFIPKFCDSVDLNNFDKLFTERNVFQDNSDNGINSPPIKDSQYEGFTYIKNELRI